MSDTFTVKRLAVINAPPEKIYGRIIDFHKMSEWSPWEKLDPEMTKTYAGAESGVGSRYSWSGNRKVGAGSMEITSAEENSNIEMDLEFLKPFKAQNTTSFILEPQGAATKVTWSMTGKKTLMTRVMGIFKSMDSMLGPDFETGLANLKDSVEN